jgi:hypothetical protein
VSGRGSAWQVADEETALRNNMHSGCIEMMKTADPQRAMFCILSLETFVPAEHALRR